MTLTPEIVNEILRLAKVSRADTWIKRTPTPEMRAAFGSSIGPIIEMPRPDKAYKQTVLAEDYEGDDEMQAAHIDFVTLIAQNAEALAEYWLTQNNDGMKAMTAHDAYVAYQEYLHTRDKSGPYFTYSGWLGHNRIKVPNEF